MSKADSLAALNSLAATLRKNRLATTINFRQAGDWKSTCDPGDWHWCYALGKSGDPDHILQEAKLCSSSSLSVCSTSTHCNSRQKCASSHATEPQRQHMQKVRSDRMPKSVRV